MAYFIVRGLDEAVTAARRAAKSTGVPIEAEVREILTEAVRRPHIGMALLSAAQNAGGVEDLHVQPRDDVARGVDWRERMTPACCRIRS